MKIGVIGGGNMGGALVQGLIDSGEIRAQDIVLANPHLEKIERFGVQGVATTSVNCDAVVGADLVVLAVKPWLVKEVIEEIDPALNPESTEVCSLAAGISCDELLSMFKINKPSSLSVAIPNTAMAVRESMTFLVKGNEEPRLAERIFGLVGKVMQLDDRRLPGAMALASCGLAYAMRYVRAACEGGVQLGLRPFEAQQMVAQTLVGAAALLREPGAHPETEIDKVTTPGGFTIRGLNAMEERGFTAAVIAGLCASLPSKSFRQ